MYLKVKYAKTYFIYFKDKGKVNYKLGSHPLKKQAYYFLLYEKYSPFCFPLDPEFQTITSPIFLYVRVSKLLNLVLIT